MRKIRLNALIERCLLYVLIIFTWVSCVSDDKNDYWDTSNVSYNERTIKLLAKKFVGNQYLKSHEIKISINIPPGKKLIPQDSLQLRSYMDSIFSSLKIIEQSTIHFTVFNETNYTNKCFLEKKGLLFCEFSPCILSYGIVYDPSIDSAQQKKENIYLPGSPSARQ